MKIYIVKDKKTHELIGSRKKKIFTRISHIKTSYAFDAIKAGTAYIEVYDLDSLKPTIITREVWPFISLAEAKMNQKHR